jgi:peptidyl-Lys metalloendopeptidase
MTLVAKWTLSAAALLAAASATAGPLDRLDIRLATAQPVVQGDASITVDVTVTNVAGHAVRVLKWQLPEDELHAPLFRVTREDGRAVPYIGPLAKRAAPRAADYVHLPAGATRSYRVELSRLYALGDGRHSVAFLGRESQAPGDASYKASAPVALWLSGRSPVDLAGSMARDIAATGSEAIPPNPRPTSTARRRAPAVMWSGSASSSRHAGTGWRPTSTRSTPPSRPSH